MTEVEALRAQVIKAIKTGDVSWVCDESLQRHLLRMLRVVKAVQAWDDIYSHKGLEHTSAEAVALRLEMHNAVEELRKLNVVEELPPCT
jgi:hypothetical protein